MHYRFGPDDLEMLQAFTDEAGEYLQRVEEELLQLEASEAKPGSINDIFRHIHTIKGLASFFGFSEITRLSHEAEFLLDSARSGRAHLDGARIGLLLDAVDALGELLGQLRAACEASSPGAGVQVAFLTDRDLEGLIGQLEAALPPKQAAAAASGQGETAAAGEGDDSDKGDESVVSGGQFDPVVDSKAGSAGAADAVGAGTGEAPPAPGDAKGTAGTVCPEGASAAASTSQEDELLVVIKGKAGKAAVENFLIEAEEHSEIVCDQLLIALDGDPGDTSAMAELFRRVHTLKGNLGLLLSFNTPEGSLWLPIKETMEVFQRMEEMLERVRALRLPMPAWAIDLCFACMDALRRLVQMVRSGEGHSDPANPPLLLQLDDGRLRLEQGDASNAAAEPSPAVEGQGTEPAEWAGQPGMVASADTPSLPAERDEAPVVSDPKEGGGQADGCPVDHQGSDGKDAKGSSGSNGGDGSKGAPGDNGANSGNGANRGNGASGGNGAKRSGQENGNGHSVRVSEEKLTRLMNAIGELAVTKNAFSQIARKLMMEYNLPVISREVKEAGQWVERISAELEDAIMAMRMTEVRMVFQKFPRVIRDIALQTGKRIQLIMEGEETELDRTIIEQIGDPLMHLVRNAADHGIEPEADRNAAGKPPQGRVWLRAYSRGKDVFIEIEDDGRGMDPQKLKAKAVEKGFITAAQAEEMSDAQAFQLIFLPGFSTARAVSEISGRGVGMDVVRNNIAALRGTVAVHSRLGQGTKMTMQLPLTLVVSRGLLVEAAGQLLILPLENVIETIKVPADRFVFRRGRRMLQHRGGVLGVLSLAGILGMPELPPDGQTPVVVLSDGNLKVGVVVDRLIDEQDVLVKALPDYLASLPGMGGATIMGDGRVALVMNAVEVIQMATGGGRQSG
ncbi:hypothetical protein GTO89_03395 [Heliobacterium gestii]|uniref:histidine kinase n=1 Tax=Heliomicrobium gestii TaxID=2699 RepID=A0A845LAX5_HELGE|nr:chemotaxis protein CheA [Heliomicrobium gestii]MBM7865839.1 two-component system chemotaxis sensor kinase CheA [Heliomicrobium gestii]MZP42080.1 hypothetical protein [Heliomicrobium gestii]